MSLSRLAEGPAEAGLHGLILALNTEKAHSVKEKSLETIRMARALAGRKRDRNATTPSSSSRRRT
jgi:hypothetical protein